jgi:hypothetical protein
MLARLCVDELGGDADGVGLPADAPFERIVDVEVMADLADVDRLAFVDKDELRAITERSGKRDSIVMMSSLTPSPR